MSKIVFLFSGQGSQYVGMGGDFFAFDDDSAGILECAGDLLGFDIKKTLTEADEAELSKTEISQPAIFTVSLLALNAARKKGIDPLAVAGHSLGEYAAMVASGVLSLENGYRAIKLRSEAMGRAARENAGGMAAVIGGNTLEIEKSCEEITLSGDYVAPVNYNSPAQTVIAGTEAGLQRASELIKAKRFIRLSVAAAFHSRLMEGAAKEFGEAIKDIPFSAPKIDFYSNVLGGKMTDFSDMPAYLSKHICSPVRFVSELGALNSDGFDTFVELGPNKVLTGLVKKTLSGVNALNIENADTLLKAEELL